MQGERCIGKEWLREGATTRECALPQNIPLTGRPREEAGGVDGCGGGVEAERGILRARLHAMSLVRVLLCHSTGSERRSQTVGGVTPMLAR